MIRKVKGGYRIISHRTGKNLGTYKTKAQAQGRMRQLSRYRASTGKQQRSLL